MSDIIAARTFTNEEEIHAWLRATARDFKEKGMTFFRASHPPDDPLQMYLEGWKVRPDDQGPCPWEVPAGAVAKRRNG